ncbi:cilia- and flagella-associated protein 97 [Brachionichthys hirsutus]|uniref:cilia- and flagella-associated protein 97 n=1 Tax=Brachionichthys hirsutus TaxID=412623 RepID=UPI003604CD5E
MFNPSDLEGEVDHSFFDSDCDDNSLSKDEKKKMDKDLEADVDSSPARESLHAKQTENAKSGCPPMDGIEMEERELIPPKGDNSSKAKTEENCQKENESGTASCVISAFERVNCNEENSNLNPQTSKGTFMALLVEDDKGYDQGTDSPNESEEELSSSPKRSCAKGRKRQSSEKQKIYLDVPASHSEQSDDTATDVSSLSSPDSSVLHGLGPDLSEDEEGSLKEEQEESVPSSGPSSVPHDEDVDACSLRSESLPVGKVVYSAGRDGRNYSFSKDEVQTIHRENNRLLRELSRISAGTRQGSTAEKKAWQARNSPLLRRSHITLNRQQEEKRIERDNLAFLKKLESVKPTRGIARSEHLADYQRHLALKGRLSPSCVTSSAGPRSSSSASHTSSDSSKTSKSKKLSAARN